MKRRRFRAVGIAAAVVAAVGLISSTPAAASASEGGPAIDVDFVGAPQLRDADCTVWSSQKGTVRWDLPENIGDAQMLLTYNIGAGWQEVEFDPSDQILESISTPTGTREYYLQWVSDGHRSAASKVSFTNASTIFGKCKASITNLGPASLPATAVVQKLERVGDQIRLTIPKSQFQSSNRILMEVNGQYAGETYEGSRYYMVHQDNGDGTVTLIESGVEANALIGFYVDAGKPGYPTGALRQTLVEKVL